MVKAIIFDLDGTLLDTSKDIHGVLNSSLKKFGVPGIPYEKTIEYVGNGAKKLVERALGCRYADKFDLVYADYSFEFKNCNNDKTTLYPNEEEVLSDLKSKGIKLAIVTNKPQGATEKVYKKHLSKFNFDIVLGQSDKFPLKPDPASTLSIIEAFKLDRRDCIFVGDGETDIATAQNAGIECVSCLWGFRSERVLRSFGGKNFVKNYRELRQFLTK